MDSEKLDLRAGARCVLPGPGMGEIPHNYGRGPGAMNLVLRVARTWEFGPEKETAGAGPTDPQHGMLGPVIRRKYSVTASAFTLNSLNHTNLGAPDGDLSSPYFGQSRSLGGFIVMAHGGAPSTSNRKIDLQIRVTF